MFSLIGKATALAAVGGKSGALIAVGAAARDTRNMDALLNVVQPSLAVEPAASGRALMSADEADSVGRDNEEIRNRCIDIITKVQGLSSLNDDLASVFGQVDAIMRELEQTKAELVQRNASFQVERDAHSELRTRFNALHDDNEFHKSDNELLRMEAERFRESVSASEARIETLENEAIETAAQLAVGGVQRQEMDAHIAYLTGELQTAQQTVQDADALISSLQSESSAERHRIALLEQNELSLQASLTEAQQTSARLKTDLDDTNIAWETALQQVAAREADVAKFQAEHTRMRGLWQQATDAHSADVSALQTQLETLKSRAEVNERLLTECRAELQAKTDELRQEERRSQESLTKVASLEQKQQGAESLNKERADRVADLEQAQAKLLQRVKPMLKAIKQKDGEIVKLRQQLESLQSRLVVEAERSNADRERAEDTIKALTESYERERVLKALAEGALETDRKERAQLQQALRSARNLQGSHVLRHSEAKPEAAGTSE